MTPRIRWQIWLICPTSLAALAILLLQMQKKSPPTDIITNADNGAVVTRSAVPKSEATSPPDRQRASSDSRKLSARLPADAVRQEEINTDGMNDEQLLEALGSTNKTSKTAAALAIARRPTTNLVSALMKAVSVCADSNLRSTLLSAVASVNSINSTACVLELVTPLGLRKDRDLQEAARTALLRSGSPAVVEALIAHAAAAPDNEYLGRDTARTLASIRNVESVPQLIAGSHTTNEALFAGCSVALGHIGEPEGLRALFDQLGGTEDLHDKILMDAIAQTRSPNALPVLTTVLTAQFGTSSSNARHSALLALANFAAEQRTPILNRYLLIESDAQLQAEARKLLNPRSN